MRQSRRKVLQNTALLEPSQNAESDCFMPEKQIDSPVSRCMSSGSIGTIPRIRRSRPESRKGRPPANF